MAKMQTAETLPHIPFDEPTALQTWRNYLTSASPTFFVCEDEDRRLVGLLMALVQPYAFATGFFIGQEVLYVVPEKRGTRAAARLIKAFSDWSDRLGPRETYTGIANGFKVERTSRFLQHFGFTPVGATLRRINDDGKGR